MISEISGGGEAKYRIFARIRLWPETSFFVGHCSDHSLMFFYRKISEISRSSVAQSGKRVVSRGGSMLI